METAPTKSGPQVFSRPGTKRHLKQVQRRIAWLTLQKFYAESDIKKAAKAVEEARAARDEAKLEADATLFLLTWLSPPEGNA